MSIWRITIRVRLVNRLSGWVQQLHLAALIGHGGKAGHHFPDAGAIDIRYFSQVEQQLANNNVNAGGSFVEAGLQQVNVRAVGLFNHVSDIARTVIKTQNGTPLRISDIATGVQGPKIRLGTFATGPVRLSAGQEFTITTEDVPGDSGQVVTTYRDLPHDVEPGDLVLVDDARIALEVVAVRGAAVRTRVVVGGVVSDHKGLDARHAPKRFYEMRVLARAVGYLGLVAP